MRDGNYERTFQNIWGNLSFNYILGNTVSVVNILDDYGM